MIMAGATTGSIEVSSVQLIGWPLEHLRTQKIRCFVALSCVRTMTERYLLEKANEAYARMMSGKAEFRVVLTT